MKWEERETGPDVDSSVAKAKRAVKGVSHEAFA